MTRQRSFAEKIAIVEYYLKNLNIKLPGQIRNRGFLIHLDTTLLNFKCITALYYIIYILVYQKYNLEYTLKSLLALVVQR